MTAGEMSDQVAAAVDQAARDAVGTAGGIVTGFVALTTYLDADGDRCWSYSCGEDQSMAQSLGMAQILDMTIKAQVEAAFLNNNDGDEA